eukprot:7482-Heterococcus_DN1.PRE.3
MAKVLGCFDLRTHSCCDMLSAGDASLAYSIDTSTSTCKVAIVTGGSTGMGLAAAQQLAAEGAKLIIAGRTQSKLDAAVKLIKEAGGEAHAIVADVSSDEDNKRIVDTALDLYGRLDLSFINAGTYGGAGFSELTVALIDNIFDTNVKSVALAFKYQLPAIEKSGGKGSVVVNTSVIGMTPTTQEAFHGAGVYAASKAAANMLTQFALATAALMLMVLQELALTLQCLFALCNTQAVEAAKHGTRVNAVAPGELSTHTACAMSALSALRSVLAHQQRTISRFEKVCCTACTYESSSTNLRYNSLIPAGCITFTKAFSAVPH